MPKVFTKFENKEIKNMSGLDINFDKPYKPSLHLKWKANMTALKISKKILKLIDNVEKVNHWTIDFFNIYL